MSDDPVRSDGLGFWHTQPDPLERWRIRDRLARAIGFHCWDCWHFKAAPADEDDLAISVVKVPAAGQETPWRRLVWRWKMRHLRADSSRVDLTPAARAIADRVDLSLEAEALGLKDDTIEIDFLGDFDA